MRIQVSGGSHNIKLVLPTALVFNRTIARIGIYYMKKYAPDQVQELTYEQLDALFAEFRRIKSKHGFWTLVDVQSADGQLVKIIL